MNNFLLAQIIGFIGLLIMCVALMQTSKQKILLWFTFYNLTTIVVYALLQQFLGSVLVVIATLRTIIYFYFSAHKKKPNLFVVLVFEILLVTISFLMWQNYFDLFLIANLVMLTYVTWQDNTKLIRYGYILSSLLLISYNIFVMAYSNLASESIALIFACAGLLKHETLKKHKG